jgi:hypothetical protein
LKLETFSKDFNLNPIVVGVGLSSNKMCHHRLFHYTTSDGAQAIQASKKLKKSDNQVQDAVRGNGVYFTKKSPWHHSKVAIVMNNWSVDRKERGSLKAGSTTLSWYKEK